MKTTLLLLLAGAPLLAEPPVEERITLKFTYGVQVAQVRSGACAIDHGSQAKSLALTLVRRSPASYFGAWEDLFFHTAFGATLQGRFRVAAYHYRNGTDSTLVLTLTISDKDGLEIAQEEIRIPMALQADLGEVSVMPKGVEFRGILEPDPQKPCRTKAIGFFGSFD